MKLSTQFLLIILAIFIGFMTAGWFYSDSLLTRINEEWVSRLSERQVAFDKQRTLEPLKQEIALARALAGNPDILNMAIHEDDASLKQRGLTVLEQFRAKFSDHTYFAAIVKSGHYYFNDAANNYAGNQLRYTLQKNNSNDAWFYATVASKLSYQINVDPDAHLGGTKVWINVQVKNGKDVVAIIGTGIDIQKFIQDTVGMVQPDVHNLFIDTNMAVQLDEDKSLIDYASLTKSVEQRRKVDALIPNTTDLARLKDVMRQLESSPDQIKTLWVTFIGKQMLLGVAYSRKLDGTT